MDVDAKLVARLAARERPPPRRLGVSGHVAGTDEIMGTGGVRRHEHVSAVAVSQVGHHSVRLDPPNGCP